MSSANGCTTSRGETRTFITTTGLKKRKRHSEEKDHMIQLRAIGSTTAEYIGSSSSLQN